MLRTLCIPCRRGNHASCRGGAAPPSGKLGGWECVCTCDGRERATEGGFHIGDRVYAHLPEEEITPLLGRIASINSHGYAVVQLDDDGGRHLRAFRDERLTRIEAGGS